MKKKSNKSDGRPIVVQSSQPIQSSVMEDIVSIIKGLFNTVCKGVDKLLEGSGYKPEGKAKPIKPEDSGDGYGAGIIRTYKAGTGETVVVTIIDCDENNSGELFYVKIECQGHRTFEKDKVRKNRIEKLVDNYIDDELGASNEGEVNNNDAEGTEGQVDASCRICKVTLQRVTSSTGVDSINLMKIQANYPIKLAMEDVEEVVDSDEFVNSLQEDEPQSFEITQVPGEENPDELEYDVNEIGNDEVDTSMSYEELLKAAAKFSFDIQCIGWGAKGPDMDNLRSRLFNFKWAAESAIDLFANLMVSETHVVPHLGKLPTGGTGGVDMSQGFDYQEGLTVLDKSIDKFIQTLEEHYINLSHEIQKRVDDLIFELKNGNSANIKRAMM